jgi:hypothetical protein
VVSAPNRAFAPSLKHKITWTSSESDYRKKIMEKQCATTIGRLDRYLFRIKRALRNDELIIALSDSAELSEIARRLYVHLEAQIAVRHQYPLERSATPSLD